MSQPPLTSCRHTICIVLTAQVKQSIWDHSSVCEDSSILVSHLCRAGAGTLILYGPAGEHHKLSGSLVATVDLIRLWHCESSRRKLVRKWAWLTAENTVDKARQTVAFGPRAARFFIWWWQKCLWGLTDRLCWALTSLGPQLSNQLLGAG